jgi:hypothetical protein
MMLELIAEHGAVMDCFKSCVPTIIKSGATVEIRTFNGAVVPYGVGEALMETFLMIIMSTMIFVWESSTYRDYSGEGAELLRNFSHPNINPAAKKSVVRDLVTGTRELNKSQSMGITMVDAIQNRMYQLDKETGKITGKISVSLGNLRSKCDQFEKLRDVRTWRIIRWFTGLLGFLYLLAAPFLLWFGQGWMTMATYPIVFLFVGGQISYRWFIGDVFFRPTDMHAQRVYDDITALAIKADRFLQHQEIKANPPYGQLVVLYEISRVPSVSTSMRAL